MPDNEYAISQEIGELQDNKLYLTINYLGRLLVVYLFIVIFASKLCSTSFVLGQHNIKL